MGLKLANNAVSTLAGALSSGAVTLAVAPGDGSKYPTLGAGDWFPLTLVKVDGTIEIVRCTGRASDTFTIVRAQEGTAAQSFNVGDHVDLRLTAAALAEFLQHAGDTMTGALNMKGVNVNMQDGGGTTQSYASYPGGGGYAISSNATGTPFTWVFDATGKLTTPGAVAIVDPSNNGTAALSITATSDANGANLKLVGNGATTPSKTLRVASGVLGVMNDAYTTPIMTLDDAGNMVLSGTCTFSSDERLKTDWEELPDDIIERVAAEVLSGTFTWIESGARDAGVGAQSMQRVFKEVVKHGDVLSVAYGNAALSLVVKLCQRIVKLEKRIETLEA